jgi:hypothetical protein
MAQAFQGQVLAKKWRRMHWDQMEGHLVLMKNKNAAKVEYQLGRVKQVFPGEDGLMRFAGIKYKNPLEKVFRATTRPIQKLVVMVPVDYWHEEDMAENQ